MGVLSRIRYSFSWRLDAADGASDDDDDDDDDDEEEVSPESETAPSSESEAGAASSATFGLGLRPTLRVPEAFGFRDIIQIFFTCLRVVVEWWQQKAVGS